MVPSYGVLGMGGVAALVAGGLMLVDGPIPQLRVQWGTVLAIAIPIGLITTFLVRLVVVSHRKKSVTGRSGMIGEVGTAATEIYKSGKVMVHGEYWGAHSRNPIEKGEKVRVVKLNGLDIEVEIVSEETA